MMKSRWKIGKIWTLLSTFHNITRRFLCICGIVEIEDPELNKALGFFGRCLRLVRAILFRRSTNQKNASAAKAYGHLKSFSRSHKVISPNSPPQPNLSQ